MQEKMTSGERQKERACFKLSERRSQYLLTQLDQGTGRGRQAEGNFIVFLRVIHRIPGSGFYHHLPGGEKRDIYRPRLSRLRKRGGSALAAIGQSRRV